MNPDSDKERLVASEQSDVIGEAGVSDAADDATGSAEGRPGVTDVQAYIGRQLRAVYDDVVKQPIPDRFLDLMKQLDDLPPG